MFKIIHNKTAQALAGWTGLLTFVFTLLGRLTPEWLGLLTWPQSILIGIAAALFTIFIGSAALALGGYGFRLLRPLPATASDGRVTSGTPSENKKIRDEVANLDRVVRAVIDDYQRMSGLEIRLSERIDALESGILERVAGTKNALVMQLATEAANRAGADESLSSRIDEHRSMLSGHDMVFEAHKWALLAIYHRERLLASADKISALANYLQDRLTNGQILTQPDWNAWLGSMQVWEANLHHWSGWAIFYLGHEPMDDIKRIEASDFDGEWSVKHDQFPDPEGIRFYKTFEIYRRNWESVQNTVHDLVRMQAFEGRQTHKRVTS